MKRSMIIVYILACGFFMILQFTFEKVNPRLEADDPTGRTSITFIMAEDKTDISFF